MRQRKIGKKGNREKRREWELRNVCIMSQIFYIHVIGIIIIFTAELSFSDNVLIMVQTSCFVILSC